MKLPQDSNTTVTLVCCLKEVKDFILQFLIAGRFCWVTQNYKRCYIQYCFFPSGGGVDDVLVSLLFIKEIIKDKMIRNHDKKQ